MDEACRKRALGGSDATIWEHVSQNRWMMGRAHSMGPVHCEFGDGVRVTSSYDSTGIRVKGPGR